MLLSIDQGTTSTRALVVDPVSFAVLGSAQQELEQHYPQDGWVVMAQGTWQGGP